MAKVKKIRKWDEVTGNAVEEQIPESIDPIEDVGAGPSISRNHMRGIEDMVEQNDNSFDGIINNVPAAPVPDFAEINETLEYVPPACITMLNNSYSVKILLTFK